VNQKTMIRFGLIPAVVMLAIFVGSSSRSVSAIDTCANPVFTPVLTSLRTSTRVPLRLPLVLADEYDAALYAQVRTVSPRRYLVRIGQNCERGYCPYGTVSGTKISKRTGRPRGIVVELAGGVTGHLTDGSKRLQNSIITWDQGQYRYEIAIYAAEPTAMIKVANSALSCDNR